MTFTPGQIIRSASDLADFRAEYENPPAPSVVNVVRFHLRIDARQVDTTNPRKVRYGGVEVGPFYDAAEGLVAWAPVDNGRTLSVSGSDDTQWASPAPYPGGILHSVGSIVPVVEQYDDDGRIVRFVEQSNATDCRVGIIMARTGTTNAAYTIRDARQDGLVYPNVTPANRITASGDGINWIAAQIGAPCMLMFTQSGTADVLVAAWVAERVELAECEE